MSIAGSLYGSIEKSSTVKPSDSELHVSTTAWSAHRAKFVAPPILRRNRQPAQPVEKPDPTLGLSEVPVEESVTEPINQRIRSLLTSIDQTAALAVLKAARKEESELTNDEYDCQKPNDYEAIIKKRRKLEQAEELNSIRRKQQLLREETPNNASSPNADTGGGAPSVAARMMQKMGWRHGEGLGREKQGIVTPLVARKIDTRSGVIVKGMSKPLMVRNNNPNNVDVVEPTSRVLLLTNLVGRGEVDSDLQLETEEEASKHGNLLRVLILEVDKAVQKNLTPTNNEISLSDTVPDEEAVRIFCEYESRHQSGSAFTSLNGRKFGSRTVKARFYDEASYLSNSLLLKLP